MQDMIDFFTAFLTLVADFLMTEPFKYFTALFIGAGVIALIRRIWKINM